MKKTSYFLRFQQGAAMPDGNNVVIIDGRGGTPELVGDTLERVTSSRPAGHVSYLVILDPGQAAQIPGIYVLPKCTWDERPPSGVICLYDRDRPCPPAARTAVISLFVGHGAEERAKYDATRGDAERTIYCIELVDDVPPADWLGLAPPADAWTFNEFASREYQTAP